MARVTYVKKAQQRFKMVPVLNEDGTQKRTAVMRRSGEQKVTKKGRPVFMDVTVADKSQPLPNHSCEKCGKEIAVGDPYKHITPKSGPYGGRTRRRCASCPSWRASETTGSQHLQVLYGAQEEAEDALGSWDREDANSLKEIVTAFAEGIREAAESYRESAQNIEDGFGHPTSMSEELEEKAQGVDDAADEAESVADDIEDFDEDAARQEVLDEHEWDEESYPEGAPSDYDWDEDPEGLDADFEAKREEWASEQEDKAQSAISELGV